MLFVPALSVAAVLATALAPRRSSSEARTGRSTVTRTTTSERLARLTRTAPTVTLGAAGGDGAADGGGGSGGGGCGGGGGGCPLPTVNLPGMMACASQM